MMLESLAHGMCIAAVSIAAVPVVYLTLADLARARVALKGTIEEPLQRKVQLGR